MGKADEEQPLPATVVFLDPQQNAEGKCCGCGSIRKFIGLRCIFVLLLSAAVFLSAVFWLPPFLQWADQKDLHSNSRYKGHDIVASFLVQKPVSLLEDNILQLEDDIFDEIEVPSTKVVILSLESLSGSNRTKVVFAVDPDGKGSEISSAAASLIRASFKALVVRESHLQLTSSMFGNTSLFEVLKFRGGITIIPDQPTFPLQKVQIPFNFTLNFSIYQIQQNFDELRSQLKSGLHLEPYENLNVSLSNSEGSTVAAPTIVQSSVVLAIGNFPPSKQRLKQLAQTITGSNSKNLGLNHTEFGRVKQVRLSSILQNTLHGNDSSDTAWSPSPAPLPHAHHHQHHHHQQHSHQNPHLAPEVSPAPAPSTGRGATTPKVESPAAAKSAPAPWRGSPAKPPDCPFVRRKRTNRRPERHGHLTPAVAPTSAPHLSAASPKKHVKPPPPIYHSSPASSPLPNVAFAHAEPPPKGEPAAERPSKSNHLHGPSLSSSSAGHHESVTWELVMFLVLVLLV